VKTIQVMVWMFVALTSNTAGAQLASSEQLQEAIVFSLLLDADPGKSRLGARNIRKFYPTDERFTDYVTERLLDLTSTEPQSKSINTVEWQIVALGELQNPRYRDTLKLVRDRTKNEDLHSRIDDALKRLGTQEAASYVPGSVNLARKRSDADSKR